jgi:hypothetical protein
MGNAEGKNWLHGFRRKWIALYFAQVTLLSLAIAILILSICAIVLPLDFKIWQLLVSFALVFIGFLIFKPTWRITDYAAAKYLNANFPQLEESVHLYLKPEAELSTLEKLQIQKIIQHLPIRRSLQKAWRKFWLCVLVLLVVLGGAYLIEKYYWYESITEGHDISRNDKVVKKEIILPEIADFQVDITPPSYTRKAMRSQQTFAIKAEVGAEVTWNISTNIAVQKLRLVFNDQTFLSFNKVNELTWKLIKTITQSGFYQVEIDGKRSDLYQIEVVPDLPVQIKIIKPKVQTTIDVGQIPRVDLVVNLVDDYGIKDAYISATLSSGKGEGVSFTEKKLNFNANFAGQKSIGLTQLLDLTKLGMKPGDELYFFVHATDNHNQSSRSEVYMISIVDTAELMSMAGMTNGVDLVPEYFRSQRQIIIDTEKLLKEQLTLSQEEFKNRANNLGMDQKLLRLRYGKFLGEESETKVGGEEHEEHSEGDGHDHGDAKFGDVQALMDEYAHKHDIAEDATFFEPELKRQLKAVLNEMWSSELRLRTYKPQEALPFEYKALRLLKDLQQKSRAYVAKTTVKAIKLKPEKRLSGELDKITNSTQQATFDQKDDAAELKMVLTILEKRKTNSEFAYGEREFLRAAEAKLISAAAKQPGSYLPALKSLRQLSVAKQVNEKDIERVQSAIDQLLGVETRKPNLEPSTPNQKLSQRYFNYLKIKSR